MRATNFPMHHGRRDGLDVRDRHGGVSKIILVSGLRFVQRRLPGSRAMHGDGRAPSCLGPAPGSQAGHLPCSVALALRGAGAWARGAALTQSARGPASASRVRVQATEQSRAQALRPVGYREVDCCLSRQAIAAAGAPTGQASGPKASRYSAAPSACFSNCPRATVARVLLNPSGLNRASTVLAFCGFGTGSRRGLIVRSTARPLVARHRWLPALPDAKRR